jgi:hypothetical protein
VTLGGRAEVQGRPGKESAADLAKSGKSGIEFKASLDATGAAGMRFRSEEGGKEKASRLAELENNVA